MADAPDNTDRWSQRLAGRGADGELSDAERREADALRSAIRADDAKATAAGAADQLGLARTLKRLEAEGLLRADAATAVSRRRPPWLAVAASVLVVAVALRFMLPASAPNGVGEGDQPAAGLPSSTPPERTRGVDATVRFQAPNPQQLAQAMVQELTALGLTARSSQRPDRMVLDVEVSAAQLPAFDAWLQTRKQHGIVPGQYRLIIDREAASSDR